MIKKSQVTTLSEVERTFVAALEDYIDKEIISGYKTGTILSFHESVLKSVLGAHSDLFNARTMAAITEKYQTTNTGTEDDPGWRVDTHHSFADGWIIKLQ